MITDSLTPGQEVYIMATCDDPSPNALYKVQILSKSSKYAVIKFPNDTTEEVPLSEILPIDSYAESGISELLLINSVTEASLLINLKSRYTQNLFFTNLGKIIIHLKPPQKPAMQLLSSEIGVFSAGLLKKAQRKSQNIVFIGESQAGKTFSFNQIFKCLFSYNEKILQVKSALFVIKAFTNRLIGERFVGSRALVYGTVYVEGGIPEGCRFECVNIDKGLLSEKGNFAVFSMIEVNDGDLVKKNGKNWFVSLKLTEKFRKSVEKLQFGEDFKEIAKVLCGILCLGNVKFTDLHGDGVISKESACYWTETCKLLSISEERLKKDLMTFTRTVGKSLVTTKLDKFECELRKKALMKLLYSDLFNWVLQRINSLLGKNIGERFIGLVDYPGSQAANVNSLEELLINYTNEKIHQTCISSYFSGVKRESIDLTDNKDVIELLENSSTGILKLLNESCMNKANSNLLSMLVNCHMLNDYFEAKGSEFSVHHSFQKVTYNIVNLREKNIDIIYTSLFTCLESSLNPTIKSIYKPTPSAKTLHCIQYTKSLSALLETISKTNLRFIYCLNPQANSIFSEKHLLKQIQYFSLIDFILLFKSSLTTSYTAPEFFSKYRLVLNTNLSTQKNIEKICEKIGVRTDHFSANNKKILISKPCEKVLNKHLETFRTKCGTVVVVIQRMWRRVYFRGKFRKFLWSIKRIQALFRGRKVFKKFMRLRFSAIFIQRWYKEILMGRKRKDEECGLRIFSQYLRRKLEEGYQKRVIELALNCQRLWRGYKSRKVTRKIVVCKKVIKYLVEKAWRPIEKIIENSSALKIQKAFRGYVCRQNLPRPVKIWMIRQKLKKSATRIQKHVKRFICHKKFQYTKKSCEKIQRAWKAYMAQKDQKKQYRSILLIQRRVRIFLIRIQRIKENLTNFLIKESSLIENLRFLEHSQVFSVTKPLQKPPGSKLEILSQLSQSSGTLSKLRLITSGSLSLVTKDQNPFHLQKMTFFARVLHMSLPGDTSLIYPTLWGSTLESISQECIQKEDLLMDLQLGYCHSIALTSKGKLFAWGWNDKNQCLNPTKKQNFLKVLKDFRILQVCCGDDHTVALTEKGEIFTFGDNSKGQLGQGNYSQIQTPTKIALPAISTISTCGHTNVAVTKDSKAFIWPYESEEGVKTSLPAQLLTNLEVSDAAVGFNFVVLLTVCGVVYTFGNNKEGQLGLGDFVDRKSPEIVVGLKKTGEKAAGVAAGLSHVIVRTTLGKVFVWGSGKNGELGTGLYKNENFPVQLSLKSGKTIQVSAGLHISVVLNESRKIFLAGNKKPCFEELSIEDCLPEFAEKKEFAVVRVKCEWNRMFSVVLCTLCDLRSVQYSHVKIQNGMNQLAAKWGKGIEPPIIETLAPFYSVASWRRSPLRNT